jgi:hypothetical protein
LSSILSQEKSVEKKMGKKWGKNGSETVRDLMIKIEWA